MYTIIIPTFNRHDLLLRAIDYYQHFDCDVFIADSSDSKFNHKLPDNIIYKHLPKATIGEKIYEVAKNITTPYVNLVADDDFLVESSMKSAAYFLDDNPGYVSAHGSYYKFELIENKVIFSPRYSLDGSYSIESEDRSTRIAMSNSPYMHMIYVLTRTDLFVKLWKLGALLSPLDLLPCKEPLPSLALMWYGKHKNLPVLWLVRDYYIFDPSRRQKYLSQISKIEGSIFYNYTRYTNEAKAVETFLDSKNFLKLKKYFCENISGLVSNEESDAFCKVFFKSHIKWLTRTRNEVTAKIILKLFIPKWAFKYYKIRKIKQYASGIEDTVFNDCFSKVRLSVLSFKKCYDNYR